MKILKLLPIFGLLVFVFIISNADLIKISETLGKMNVFYLALFFPLSFLAVILKALKWKFLIKSYGVDYKLKKSMSAWLAGFSMGMITPGRVGDFSRAYYLKQDKGLSFGKSLTTVIIDRIMDVSALFFFATVGLLAFATLYISTGFMLIAIVFMSVIFMSVIFFITKKNTVQKIFKPFFMRFVPGSYKQKIRPGFHDFYSGLDFIFKNKGLLLVSIFLSIAALLISIIQYFLLSLAIGTDIGFGFFLFVAPIVMLLDTLPISFSGVGTREAALIFFLSFLSLSPEFAVSLSLLIFFLGYITLAIPGFVIWARKSSKSTN